MRLVNTFKSTRQQFIIKQISPSQILHKDITMESKSAQRIQVIANHIEANQTFNASTVPAKSDDDVVIVSFARTAMTKAKKGAQRDTAPEAMLAPVLKAVVKNSGIDAKLIEDVCIGNVLQPGAGAHTSRMAMFLAGLPDTASL